MKKMSNMIFLIVKARDVTDAEMAASEHGLTNFEFYFTPYSTREVYGFAQSDQMDKVRAWFDEAQDTPYLTGTLLFYNEKNLL